MSDIINTTDSNFKSDVLDSDIPVLVDFWASWCAPCKQIAPVLVTANEQTSLDYNIRNIPALLIFKNGEKVDQKVGAAPRSQLVAFIEQHI
jgi:thioredoxin 1